MQAVAMNRQQRRAAIREANKHKSGRLPMTLAERVSSLERDLGIVVGILVQRGIISGPVDVPKEGATADEPGAGEVPESDSPSADRTGEANPGQ